MEKITYCATHDTYPLPNEPCWQCANPFIVEASQVNADLLEALETVEPWFSSLIETELSGTDLYDKVHDILVNAQQTIRKAKCPTES